MTSKPLSYEENELLKDPKYRSYVSSIDKVLKLFENSSEWADLIPALGKLNKILSNHTKYPVVPRSLVITKRLAQCMNHKLPSGVHLKALEIYDVIFKSMGTSRLARDLFIYSTGLFPLLANSALTVRPVLLTIYETHFVPLGDRLRPALSGFLIGILPGLDINSDYSGRINEIVEKVCDGVGFENFYSCLWKCLLTNPAIRLAGFTFVLNHFNKQITLPSQTFIFGNCYDIFVDAICSGIQDSNILVQRSALDFLLAAVPVKNAYLTNDHIIKLIKSSVTILLRKDVSLNRRLYTWLFDSDTFMIDEHDDETEEHLSEQNFDNGIDQMLLEAIRLLLEENSQFIETNLFKLLTLIFDEFELHQVLLTRLTLDIVRYAYNLSKSISQSQAEIDRQLNARESTITTVELRQKLRNNFNYFCSSLEANFFWTFVKQRFDRLLNDCETAKMSTSSSASESSRSNTLRRSIENHGCCLTIGSERVSIDEFCLLVEFLIEMVSNAADILPDLFSSFVKSMQKHLMNIAGTDLVRILELLAKVLVNIQPLTLDPKRETSTKESGTDNGQVNFNNLEKSKSDSRINDSDAIRRNARSISNDQIGDRFASKRPDKKSSSTTAKKSKSTGRIDDLLTRNNAASTANDELSDDDELSTIIENEIFRKSTSTTTSSTKLSKREIIENVTVLNCFEIYKKFFVQFVQKRILPNAQKLDELFAVLIRNSEMSASSSTGIESDDFSVAVSLRPTHDEDDAATLPPFNVYDNSFGLCLNDKDQCDLYDQPTIAMLNLLYEFNSFPNLIHFDADENIVFLPKWLKALIVLACYGKMDTNRSYDTQLCAINILLKIVGLAKDQNFDRRSTNTVIMSILSFEYILFIEESTFVIQAISQILWKFLGVFRIQKHAMTCVNLLYFINNVFPTKQFAEKVICRFLSADTLNMEHFKKFSVLWHLGKTIDLNSRYRKKSVRHFDKCLLKILDNLQDNCQRHHLKVFTEELVLQSLLKNDTIRLINPILRLLLSKTTARISINFYTVEKSQMRNDRDKVAVAGAAPSEDSQKKCNDQSTVSSSTAIAVSDALSTSYTSSDHLAPKQRNKFKNLLFGRSPKKERKSIFPTVVQLPVPPTTPTSLNVPETMAIGCEERQSIAVAAAAILESSVETTDNVGGRGLASEAISTTASGISETIAQPLPSSLTLSPSMLSLNPLNFKEVYSDGAPGQYIKIRNALSASTKSEDSSSASVVACAENESAIDENRNANMDDDDDDQSGYIADVEHKDDVKESRQSRKNANENRNENDEGALNEDRVQQVLNSSLSSTESLSDVIAATAPADSHVTDDEDNDNDDEDEDDEDSQSLQSVDNDFETSAMAEVYFAEAKRKMPSSLIATNNNHRAGRVIAVPIIEEGREVSEAIDNISTQTTGNCISVYSMHSHILLYCDTFDTEMIIYALKTFKNCLSVNQKLFVNNLATIKLQNSVINSSIFCDLARHHKAKMGINFASDLAVEDVAPFKGAMFLEAVIIICLNYASSFFANSENSKITDELKENNLKIQLLSLEILDVIVKNLTNLVHENNDNFQRFVASLLSKSDLQKTILQILLVSVRDFDQEPTLAEHILKFNGFNLFNANDQVNELVEAAQMQLLRLVQSIIILEYEVYVNEDNESKPISRHSITLMTEQSMFLSAVLSALRQSKIRHLHENWSNMITASLPFFSKHLKQISISIVQQICQNIETNTKEYARDPANLQSSLIPHYLLAQLGSLTSICHFCLIDSQQFFSRRLTVSPSSSSNANQNQQQSTFMNLLSAFVPSTLTTSSSAASSTNPTLGQQHQQYFTSSSSITALLTQSSLGDSTPNLNGGGSSLIGSSLLASTASMTNDISNSGSASTLIANSCGNGSGSSGSTNGISGSLAAPAATAATFTDGSAASINLTGTVTGSGPGSSGNSNPFSLLSSKKTYPKFYALTRKALMSQVSRVLSSLLPLWKLCGQQERQRQPQSHVTRIADSDDFYSCLGYDRLCRQQILDLLAPIATHHNSYFMLCISLAWYDQKFVSVSNQKSLVKVNEQQESLIDMLMTIKAWSLDTFISICFSLIRFPNNNFTFPNDFRLNVIVYEISYCYINLCPRSQIVEHCVPLFNLIRESFSLSFHVQLIAFMILSDIIQKSCPFSDKKDQKELQDITAKMIECLSQICGSSLEQTTWLRKNLSVREQDADTISLVPSSISSALDQTQINYSLEAQILLANQLANMVDVAYGSSEKEKVNYILTQLLVNVIPFLKYHSHKNLLSFNACSQLVAQLSNYQYTRKVWKKDVFDLMMDLNFFQMDFTSLTHWKVLVDNLMTQETSFRDLLVRVSLSQNVGLTLFSSKDQEYEQRAQMLKRLAFVIYCSEVDQYAKYLPDIQEQLKVSLKLCVPNVLVQVFYCYRILLIRMSSSQVTHLWPFIVSEMVQVFLLIEKELESDLIDYNFHCKMMSTLDSNWYMNISSTLQSFEKSNWLNLQIAAVKLLDIALLLPTTTLPQFQLYRWAFFDELPTNESSPIAHEQQQQQQPLNQQTHYRAVSELFVPYAKRILKLMDFRYGPIEQPNVARGQLILQKSSIDSLQSLHRFFKCVSYVRNSQFSVQFRNSRDEKNFFNSIDDIVGVDFLESLK